MDRRAIILLCRIAANSMEHIRLAGQMLEDTYLTKVERQRWAECLEDHRWTGEAITEILPDAELIAACRGNDDQGGADVLHAEAKRRGLPA